MDKAYEANQWETKIYQLWEKSDYFNPDNLPTPRHGQWSCIMPPPNATGILHIGHVMMVAYQDTLTRYWRLSGKRTLWLPGTDHAAIATQTTVEKQIFKEEGKTRHQLGRQEFLRRVNDFVAKSQNIIHQQLRATGASTDWSREAFTLDETRQLAVRTAFKKMYDAGLIYRGERVINWCPRCQSTLADDEVTYNENIDGKLYTIQYGPLQVATTRPETKLGDTGAAVNPNDTRYKKYIGQTLDVNLAGHKIKVKVVADHEVDMKFGTGVVGVTPAHSATDERLAKRHNLITIKVISEDGKMTALAGKYAGLTINEARQKFLENLKQTGQLLKIEKITHSVGTCYRCHTPIEPLPKKQWFVAVDKKPRGQKLSLKQLVTKAVTSKKITITPNRFAKDYLRWAHDLHDWCISRQIWYGHRIPAYYYSNDEVLVTDQLPTSVIWTRHGQTTMTAQNIIQGRSNKTNTPLSPDGQQEAEQLAKSLINEKIDLILTSPLVRSKQTADILGKKLKIKVITEPLLTERDYGVADGQTINDVEKKFPAYTTHRRTAVLPQAETAEQLAQRVKKLFTKITKQYPGKTIVCVTHNGLLRSALHTLTGKEMETTAERVSPAEICLDCRSVLLAPNKNGDWQLKQDEDTLDTWFSSSLWTFSTLGWPKITKDLKTFHPTQWMETGYDILNMWVSRMVMMSEFFMKEIPFKNVYLHGIVRDEQGRKMSKSLGNGIDPLDVIPLYGADALRLALMAGIAPGNDVRLSKEKIAGFRNFTNKLWNIGRFILTTCPNAKPNFKLPTLATPADQWIVSCLNQTIKTVTKNLENYQFSQAIETLHNFTWGELADWYLEASKIQPNPKLLTYLLTQILIIWHPFCPFVTESLWSNLTKSKNKKDLLMVQKWPTKSNQIKMAESFNQIKEIITGIRSFRSQTKTDPRAIIKVAIAAPKNLIKILTNQTTIINRLARCNVDIKQKISGEPSMVVGRFKLYCQLPVDQQQRATQVDQLQQYITSLKNKLADVNFLSRAPTQVVEQQKQKLHEAEEKLKLLS